MLLMLAMLFAASPSVAAACPGGANQIVVENCLPGTPQSQWDVAGAGSSSIQGFATDISVNRGSVIHFKIDTDASAYHLDIYRMGYYGGAGARYIDTVSHTGAQTQPACSRPEETGQVQNPSGLIDCGNWGTSAQWNVPASAVSGVYFAKVIRDDTLAASHIVFVVRDDAGHSDLFFQTSDTTWQAYNTYGGRSLYVGDGPGSNPSRAYKVSYNRPITTRGTSPEDFVFNAEYPMIRWLERNGYDVSYTTGVDSDRSGALIRNHRAFLSVGHDEYWSGTQRANVTAARDAGVNLAFFSGNEVFWKTRWESSNRTLVTYKETHNDAKIDPLANVWTGSWRDPRPFNPEGAQPENALTGTSFLVNEGSVALQVPPEDGRLRLWRGSSVATQAAAGQTSTLTQDSVGYEWDEDPDNGARPAGLVDLSSTTASGVQVLQDYGHTYGSGTAAHHLTLYRDTNGAGPDALVFGAGTVQWSWGLDDQHDRGSPLASSAMQQATVNLFADMGPQPASLQAGLSAAGASTDTAAPAVVITAPGAGATVTPGVPVTVRGTGTDTGGGRVGAVEVSGDGGATWHPASGRESWSYVWTPSAPGQQAILARAADDSGNLGAPAQVTVGVPERTCPCTLFGDSATPNISTDAAPVEVGVRFRADANGTITKLRYYGRGAGRKGHLWTAAGQQLGGEVAFADTNTLGWHEATLSQPVQIAKDTTYVASYFTPDGAYAAQSDFFASSDFDAAPLHAPAAGNGAFVYGGGFPTNTFGSTNYYVDVVFQPSDATPPSVTAVAPVNGATGVDPGTAVTATFDEAVDPASVTSGTLLLRDGTGSTVAADVSYDAGSRTAILRPRAALARGITYSALVKGGAGGVRDTSANALAQDRAWTFTTAPAPGGGSPGEGAIPAGGSGGATGGGGASGKGPTVTVTPRSVRVSRTGTVALRFACPRRCRVSLRLTLGRQVLASKTFTVTGGKAKTVTLKLSRAALRQLASRHTLRVVAIAIARDTNGRQATTRTSIRLISPGRH
jgi:N,N-dimethylformamidase beta subunit-like protein/uncharacterized protein DUF4082/Big-like domain-containing protein